MGDYNPSQDCDRLRPLQRLGIGSSIVDHGHYNEPASPVPSKPTTDDPQHLKLDCNKLADPSDNDLTANNDQDTASYDSDVSQDTCDTEEDGNTSPDTEYTDNEDDTETNTDNHSDDRESNSHTADGASQGVPLTPMRVFWSLVQNPVQRTHLNNGRCARTTAHRIAADAVFDRCAPVFASGENVNQKLAAMEPFVLLTIPMMMVQDLDLRERVKYQQIVAAISNLSYDLGAINYGERRVSAALVQFFRLTHLDEMFSYSFPLEWKALQADLELSYADLLLQRKMRCASLGTSPTIVPRELTPEWRGSDAGGEAPGASPPITVIGDDQGFSFVDEAASSPKVWSCLKRNKPFERWGRSAKRHKSVAGLVYRSGDEQIYCKPYSTED